MQIIEELVDPNICYKNLLKRKGPTNMIKPMTTGQHEIDPGRRNIGEASVS